MTERHEFLLEIGTEELPAGFIGPALDELGRLLSGRLEEQGLNGFEKIRTVATPRRLTICVSGLAPRQPDRQEEILGPSKQAAFDKDNKPTKAALGFARSRGVGVEKLQVVSTPKGEYVMLTMEKKGEATEKILAEILPGVIKGISFPKSMRWGKGEFSFARPIHWLLALYHGKIVPFSIGEIVSGDQSRGHRFMAPAAIRVKNYDHYLEALRQAAVLVDISARRQAVRDEVDRAAAEVLKRSGQGGGRVLADEELLDTVSNLVESPFAVAGFFEERFLALPASVLITAMREHQKYFCVVDERGGIIPGFVAVNNTDVKDKLAAAEGHQRVLRARLEDALFFYNGDRKRTLADRIADLSGVIFQARLGTMHEKTMRLQQLAVKLAGALAPATGGVVARAAYLAKADLLTAMVNEFPSLQGVIGRDYALADGESEEVARAIHEHYLPVRAGGSLPSTLPGALVALADRLDTIAGCFGIGQAPTGTADPFGLRRSALGALNIIEDQAFEISLDEVVDFALGLYGDKLTEEARSAKQKILNFVRGRFVNDMIARGLPADAVDAVVSVFFAVDAGAVNVVDCQAKIRALAAIKDQPSFTVLAASFKRVMNIINRRRKTDFDAELFQEDAERGLHKALLEVSSQVAPLLEQKDYSGALEVILRMKEPVDSFFDGVMVMTEDPARRENRLNLLTAVAELFLRVGDFSRMHAVSL